MSKGIKIFLASMMILGLMAPPAFAGTAQVSHVVAGANYLIGVETLGANRNVSINGVTGGNTAGLSYKLGQSASSGQVLTVTFTGASFQGTSYNVCAINATGGVGQSVGNATITAGSANYAFGLAISDASLIGANAGNVFWLSNNDCKNATAANAVTPVRINSTASTGFATVTFSLSTGGTTLDTCSTNIATIGREFSSIMSTADAITIDYLGTPGNGTQFLASVGGSNVIAASTSNAANFIDTPQDHGASNNNAQGSNAGLTVGASVTLSDSRNWTGVNNVYLVANGTNCALAGNIAINSAPSGNVTLALPTTGAFNFNGSAPTAAGVNAGVCIGVNGSNVIDSRTISMIRTITVSGTGAQTPSPSASAARQIWDVNGYQAIVPLIQKTANAPVYCSINNGGATAANILMDVRSTEGGAVTTRYTLGSIAAGTTQLFRFNDLGVASAGPGGVYTVIDPLTAIPAGIAGRYSARFTVTTQTEQVTTACMQTDPSCPAGSTCPKRLTPVLTGWGNNYWAQ